MEKIQKTVELVRYALYELSSEYADLVKKAQEALKGSYSPYSRFPVGAAILLNNGSVILGSNQENAAYPSGLCAERTALFYFGANYPESEVRAMAVAIGNRGKYFPFPCGSCLQVMSEYQQKQTHPYDILLLHAEEDEILISRGVENLLPFAFKKEHLIR